MANLEENKMHDHDHDHDHGHEMVTITLENDEELNCVILGNFDVEETEYIALLPEGTDEVLIYRFVEKGDEIDLQNIESDEEFEKVSVAFNQLMDELGDEMEQSLAESDELDQ